MNILAWELIKKKTKEEKKKNETRKKNDFKYTKK